jgi:retron-type reverse transcriptase
MNALYAFWAQDGRSLHHLNNAFLVLLRKKAQPAEIHDYRPISLIHSFGKLITKCLANRLAPKLDALVSRNQSTFIKGRCIHDNFRAVWLSCKALHATKTQSVLLKIDIAKAFDTVSWTFLLEVLLHMGFGRRWRNWMSLILSSASTKILLNGNACRRICHARGLRQGDPLSPMLFILVMEVINHTIRWLDQQGLLAPFANARLPQCASIYANDLILFVAPRNSDLSMLRTVLQVFGQASGLFANLDKSVATPIHCTDAEI